MKRYLIVILLALASLVGGVVLAATQYSAPVAITENQSNSYSMLPVMWDSPNTWLADNNYMSSTANDTRVETLGGLTKPHMVTDNRTLTAIAVPADSQTNLFFTTWNTALNALDIILGYWGFITTTDNACLELSDNFSTTYSGYVDNITEDIIFTKGGSLIEEVVAGGKISGSIYDSGSTSIEIQQANNNQTATVYGDNWFAESFYSNGFAVASVDLRFWDQAGNPGTANVSIQGLDDNGFPDGRIFTSMAVDITGRALNWYNHDFPDVFLPADNYSIVVRLTGGDAGNNGGLRRNTAGGYANGEELSSTDGGVTWAHNNSLDLAFKLYSVDYDVTVETNALSAGEYDITLWADTAFLHISVDGVETDNVALGGASCPDNDSPWYFMSRTTPYANYFKLYDDGNLVLRYEPDTIILATSMPDRALGNTGNITWGDNPDGVGAILGSMTSSATVTISSDTETSRDLLPPTQVSDWFGDGTVSSATTLANPFRSFITAISDNTTLSEIQVWRWMGIIMVIFMTMLCAKVLRGHQGITAIIAGVLLGGLVAFDHNIFPLWLLIISLGGFIGGLVSERTPSL